LIHLFVDDEDLVDSELDPLASEVAEVHVVVEIADVLIVDPEYKILQHKFFTILCNKGCINFSYLVSIQHCQNINKNHRELHYFNFKLKF